LLLGGAALGMAVGWLLAELPPTPQPATTKAAATSSPRSAGGPHLSNRFASRSPLQMLKPDPVRPYCSTELEERRRTCIRARRDFGCQLPAKPARLRDLRDDSGPGYSCRDHPLNLSPADVQPRSNLADGQHKHRLGVHLSRLGRFRRRRRVAERLGHDRTGLLDIAALTGCLRRIVGESSPALCGDTELIYARLKLLSFTETDLKGFEFISRARQTFSARFRPLGSPGLLHELLHATRTNWETVITPLLDHPTGLDLSVVIKTHPSVGRTLTRRPDRRISQLQNSSG
jgi:hypothetical protein